MPHSNPFWAILLDAGSDAPPAGSTRLLVTHQKQYLPYCDRVLVLREGQVTAFGTWTELQELTELQAKTAALVPCAASQVVEFEKGRDETVDAVVIDLLFDKGRGSRESNRGGEGGRMTGRGSGERGDWVSRLSAPHVSSPKNLLVSSTV